jgi:hypothetical protein
VNKRFTLVLYSLLIGLSILSAVLFFFGRNSVKASTVNPQTRKHKVILPAGTLKSDKPGVTLLQDYGSFALYRVSDQADELLSAQFGSDLILADDLDEILIDAYRFNTQTESLILPDQLRLEKLSGSTLQLVQFIGPIKAEWLSEVEAAGSTLVHYVANDAYLVWMDETGRSELNSMVTRGDFLQYSGVYQPYFKLGPSLIERFTQQSEPNEIVPVWLQIYRHEGNIRSKETIKALSIQEFSSWSPIMAFETIQVKMRLEDIYRVANLPDVYWIGEMFERGLMDEVQGQILAGNFDAGFTGPDSPGYLSWLNGYGFSTNPDDYPILDITDDGIGNGTVNSGDSTLYVSGNLNNATRLAYVQNCTSEDDGGGPDGHGHLNASIAGGYDDRSGSPYKDGDGFNRGLGINPYGRLAGTRVFGLSYDASNCGDTDLGVIQTSYAAGARISSNSWGCGACADTYDISSQAYDFGTRDAEPNLPGNQQFLFVFAAGNNGPGSGSVGSPGNAKNVITVGASENDRPNWIDGCLVGPVGSDNAMDVIYFSSRGPTPGDRVKPEMVAPGTHIQGTASTNPDYNGSGVCDTYYPYDQFIFAASSGTSHSTPAIAGVASLYYYWLEHTYGLSEPSPAMLKAFMLAHPTYLTGTSANDNLPSNNQGYGMPDMSAAFDDTSRYLVDQTVIFGNTGETWIYKGVVADPSKPVRIVMAYTDQAGAVGVSPQVNDLNLAVEVAGNNYLGNNFNHQWSFPGGFPDSKNNYEAVFLPAGTSGDLDITVTAFNIAGDGVPNFGDNTDQDFALVCYNCAQASDFILSADPNSQSICSSETPTGMYTINVGQIMGFDGAVTLSASGLPTGSTANFSDNPISPPGSSQLSVSQLDQSPAGNYDFQVTGLAQPISHTISVVLNLYYTVPSRPDLNTPSNGATNQANRPTFSWDSVGQAESYAIQIATDNDFNDIVVSAQGLTKTTFTPQVDLESGRSYYWRVSSQNTCGNGDFSSTYRFSTIPQPGDCPIGYLPYILYSEGFDFGSDGWNHSGISDTWTLSTDRKHSSPTSFYAADLDVVSDQYLVSPEIFLPPGLEPLYLEFWNYQELESDGGTCWDGSIAEVSTDGGTNWEQIPNTALLTDPYDGYVSFNFDNPLGSLEAWCGNPQDWLNSIVTLDGYAGESVKFRFRLGTDYSISKEGWYIDDVKVQGCQPTGIDISPLTQTRVGSLGEVVWFTYRITNTGLVDNSFALELYGNQWQSSLPSDTGVLLPGTGKNIDISVNIPNQPTYPLTSDISKVIGSDSFTLRAVSALDSNVFMEVTGTTLLTVNPGVAISGDQSGESLPGGSISYPFTITNTGDFTDTFTFKLEGLWQASLSPIEAADLGAGDHLEVTLTVEVPNQFSGDYQDTTTITATSSLDANIQAVAKARTIGLFSQIYLPIIVSTR